MSARGIVAGMLFLLAPLASQARQGAPELRGSGWVNGKELSLERLKGKAVVLYFFEEG